MIIFVFGLPGSGKSFFAKHLAEKVDAEYISSDRIRKELFNVRTYSENEKQKVYDEMLSRTMQLLRENKKVVLDATFYKAAKRKKFVDVLKSFDTIFFIEVQAEEPVIKERLGKSREDSEADFEVYDKIKKEWEPLMEKHLTLQSTNDNIGEMLKKASDYLHQL
jgi:predicted kinase